MTDPTAGSRPLAAAIVRAPVQRGRIVEVRLPELAGSYVALTAKDIPGRNLLVYGGFEMPFLASEGVKYLGEPTALLAGPDPERVMQMAAATLVVCEPRPASGLAGETLGELSLVRGDPEAALAGAARIVEGSYSTGPQDAPWPWGEEVLAETSRGELRVRCATTDPFALRDNLAALLGQPPSRVRVIAEPPERRLGGAPLRTMLAAGHAGLLAWASGRAVRLETVSAGAPAVGGRRPRCKARYRSGLDEHGSLVALEAEIEFHVGAYAVFCPEILERALIAACGGYRCEAVRVRARLVADPDAPAEALPGCGEVEAFFALEQHVTRIAREAGLAPWEWRKRALGGASAFPSGMRWNREDPISTLEDVLERSDFCRKWSAYEAASRKRASASKVRARGSDARSPLTVVGGRLSPQAEGCLPLRGIGLAVAFHGLGRLGGPEERSAVRLVLDERRRLHIASSQAAAPEAAAWVRTAAEVLGLSSEEVILEPADTAGVPDSGPGPGSRIGSLLRDVLVHACRAVKSARLRRSLPIQVTRSATSLRRPASAVWSPPSPRGEAYHTLSWEAAVVEVEVDSATYRPACRGVWVTLEGDSEAHGESLSAFLQEAVRYSLGLALLARSGGSDSERSLCAADGYRALSPLDAPEIAVAVLERGKSGFGDLPGMAAAAAAVAAVAQAAGREIVSVPVSPVELAEEVAS